MNLREEIIAFDDLFDRLPDDIVLSIFNKLHDAKSLCLSMSVCKRFRSIVPEVDQVFLSIPLRKGSEICQECDEENSSRKNVVVRTLMRFRPIRFISQMMKLRSRNDEDSCDGCAMCLRNDVLKPFDEMRALHLRIPCHGFKRSGSRNGKKARKSTTFLKWKAEFGGQLQSCVIIGAKSWSEPNHEDVSGCGLEQEPRMMSEAELKLRIVWTLSCLIAASARHYLVQQMVKDRQKVEHVVVSDESEQGVICMDREQIEEMRGSQGKGSGGGVLSECRSLRMKIWYAERMQVPGCRKVMEGATLVVIRPDSVGDGRSNGDLVAAAFGGVGEEEVVGEFARKLVLIKRCLTLEMNAF